MFAHYERAMDSQGNYVKFGNQNIDLDRIYLNYDLAEKTGSLKDRYDEIMSRVYCWNRKDVKTFATWIVTVPEDLPVKDHRKFFEKCYEFLSLRYNCSDNVIGANVHMDETTPHMHFSFVPLSWDSKKDRYKVSAKEVLTKNDLKTFHQDLNSHMYQAFGRDIGVLNGKTIGVENVKDIKVAKEAIAKHEKMASELENKMFSKALGIVSLEEDEKRLRGNLERLRGAVDDLQRQKDNLSREIKEDITSLDEETSKIEKLLHSLQELLSKLFSNLRNLTPLGYSKSGERVQIRADIPTRLYQDILHQQKEITSLVNQTSARKESVLGKIKKHQETIRQEDQNIPLPKKEKNLGFER